MSAALQHQDVVDVNPINTSEPAPLPPMLVYPDLAQKLGFNEAVLIAQTHYWSERSKHTRIEDGCRWIWNSVREWLQQFCWMSKSTLERVISKLEKLRVLLSQKFNKRQRIKGNQTKWYRLDYKKLQEDYGWSPADKPGQKSSQSDKAKPARMTSVPQNDEMSFHQDDEMSTEITNQRLQKPSSKTEEEEMGGIFEKDLEQTANSQQPINPLPKSETTEPGAKEKSLTTLENKPKPRRKTKDSERDKNFRRDVVHVLRKLLENQVFIQWWVNRIEKSGFDERLWMPSRDFVLSQICNKPELASNMWKCFQKEVTHRVENINLRQERGITITNQEREEVEAIAPYSTVALAPMLTALPSAEHAQQSLEEYIAEHRKKLEENYRKRMETRQASDCVEPSKGRFNNDLAPPRLLTKEEIQVKKREMLRLDTGVASSTPLTPDHSASSRGKDYDESEYLGSAINPADFELWEEKND